MTAEDRIASYLRRAVADKRGGALVRLECRHYKVNSKKGTEIWSSEAVDQKPDAIAREIARECEDDAENRGSGPQRYGVLVYREGDPEKASGPLVVMVTPAEGDSDGELDTEPATSIGQLGMTMRHLEATQRMLLGSMAAMMGAQEKMVERVSRENDKLREAHVEAMGAIEEVYSQRHERELASQQAQARTEILKDGASKLAALAPIALAHLTGKTSPHLAAAARVQAVLGDMTDEQKAKLLTLITSEDFDAKDTQKIALGDLMSSINGDEDSRH